MRTQEEVLEGKIREFFSVKQEIQLGLVYLPENRERLNTLQKNIEEKIAAYKNLIKNKSDDKSSYEDLYTTIQEFLTITPKKPTEYILTEFEKLEKNKEDKEQFLQKLLALGQKNTAINTHPKMPSNHKETWKKELEEFRKKAKSLSSRIEGKTRTIPGILKNPNEIDYPTYIVKMNLELDKILTTADKILNQKAHPSFSQEVRRHLEENRRMLARAGIFCERREKFSTSFAKTL